MTSFEFFSVALSFVLGLGLTRLLLGGVSVFRARRRQKIHWIPVTWGISIFLFQIQYWWAIFELQGLLEAWTHWRFMSLLALTIALFVAGALILPASKSDERENLIEYFDEDGRFALLAITAYSALSMWANWYLFDTSPISGIGAAVVVFFAISLGAFFARNRKVLSVLTVGYLVMAVWAYYWMAPVEY